MGKSIGERILATRKKHGMSLEQVAARIGVSFATVRRWELGNQPKSDSNRRAAEAFLSNPRP